MGQSTRHESGQAALALLLVSVAVFVTIAAGLSVAGGVVVDSARAQSAADAAALASLQGGRGVAERFADVHGARVVSWRLGPGPSDVTVIVSVDGQLATATASNAP